MRYRKLGTTGLKVSLLSLGAATLGSKWGPRWTMDATEADSIIGLALDHGINLFDTANVYNSGESEVWLGKFLRASSSRDRVIVSTKFSYRTDPQDINSGGCSRRNMFTAVDRSLKRLGFEYIDLYYLHLWDKTTPVEETLSAAADLVASGKIRYFGLCNVPGWYLGQADILSKWRGWPKPAAIQVNYNLIARSPELELLPFAESVGMGVIAWGALANGLLAGRYELDRERQIVRGSGRLTESFSTGHVDPFDPITARVLGQLKQASESHSLPPSCVALAWLCARPRLSSILLGISSVEQLRENLATIDTVLKAESLESLDKSGAPPVFYPHTFLQDDVQVLVHGQSQPAE